MRFLSTVPWAQRLRTCCTDRLIIEWSAPSALIVAAGRQRGAPGGAARRVSQAASSPPGRHRGAREGEAWAAGGTAAPAQGPRRAAGARHATRLGSRREAREDRQPAGTGRGTRLIAGTRDEAAAPGRGTCRPPAARSLGLRVADTRGAAPSARDRPGSAHARARLSRPRLPRVSGCAGALPRLRVRRPQPLRTRRPPAVGRRERLLRHWRHRRGSLLIGCSEGTASTPLAPARLRAPGDPEAGEQGGHDVPARGTEELSVRALF